MAITFSTLPTATATVGVAYGPSSFVATGGTGPYTYAVTGGIVPPGMALSSAGALSGTPTSGNVYTFQVTATDSHAATGFFNFSLVVSGGVVPPVGNPIALHTFDYYHSYISTRDNAPPGQGAWTNPVTIVDGTFGGYPAVGPVNAFSCGALNQTEPKNILGFDGQNAMAYLGNGLPTVPVQLVFPGGSSPINNSPVTGASLNIHYGEFLVGGALWKAVIDPSSNSPVIIKTVGGVPSIADAAHAPNNNGNPLALQRVDNYLYFFLAQTGTNFAIYPFNMATGLWEASFAPINLTDFDSFHFEDTWINGLYKFANGDFLVLYNTATPNPALRLWTAATTTWSAAVLMTGNSYANSVMDPSLGLVHIFKYNSAAVNSGAVGYSMFTHAGAVLADNVATIPAGLLGGDGVNHPSIQNGKLFVPYDDASDNTNAVWVGTLPAPATFVKEFLPRPVGENNTIDTWTSDIRLNALATRGTDYAAFDTGTIDGGIADYLAQYIVTGTQDGLISAFTPHAPGAGYTNGGAVHVGVVNQTIFQITSVDGNGGITGLIITNQSGGTGNVVSSNVPILGGPPAGGIGAFTSVALGTGYAINDTGTINGGSTPAPYTVTSVGAGGSVTGLTVGLGAGYSVASNVATTRGGAQPGVGTGLQINITEVTGGATLDITAVVNGVPSTIALDGFQGGGYAPGTNTTTRGGSQPGVGSGLQFPILTVGPKGPSCMYMMFPNGYSLPLALACPSGSTTLTVGVPYSGALIVTGGMPPYTFAIIAGALPPGLTLNPSTGIISGTPTIVGTFTYTAQVTDANGTTAVVAAPCPLTVKPPGGGAGNCPPIVVIGPSQFTPVR
jgi:hypothetical protein